ERLLELGREGDPWSIAPRALDSVGRDEVESNVLGICLLLCAAGELDQLGDQRRHLAQLIDDIREQALALAGGERALAREHLDVRAQRSEERRVGKECRARGAQYD